jgi:four helix bundle protein
MRRPTPVADEKPLLMQRVFCYELRISDYRKLEAFQLSRQLVKKCYLWTAGLPNDEKYGLVSQIRRAAVSIPSNLAEGSGRRSDRDYRRFVRIAIGSVNEVEVLTQLCLDIGLIEKETAMETEVLARRVRQMLARLASTLD